MKTILITRPEPQNSKTSLWLKDKGYNVISEPLTQIQFFKTPLPPENFDYVIVTSANAVDALMHQDWQLAKSTQVISIAEMTTSKLQAAGFDNIKQSPTPSAQEIPQWLQSIDAIKNKTILRIKAEHEAFNITQQLQHLGAKVIDAKLYEATASTQLSHETIDAINHDQIDAIFHYSKRAIDILDECAQKHKLNEKLAQIYHICISYPTSQIIMLKGWNKISVARRVSDISMLNALEEISHSS